MTPEEMIQADIIQQAIKNGDFKFDKELNENTIYDAYVALEDEDIHWDYEYEMRSGQLDTNISSPSSRHYESKSVAHKMSNGQWVGWTYWYGGGKHAEPESINWMNEAYFLDCVEEEKVVITRKFSKVK